MEEINHYTFPILQYTPPYCSPQESFFQFPPSTYDCQFKAASCYSGESSPQEHGSDVFSPGNFLDSSDEEDNSSLKLKTKPPPPSYLEHLLLSESFDYHADNANFSNHDFHFSEEQLGNWISDDSRNVQVMETDCFLYEPREMNNDFSMIPSYFSPPSTPHNWNHVPAAIHSFKPEDDFYFFPSNDQQNGLLGPNNTTCTETSHISSILTEQRGLSTTWSVNQLTNYHDQASIINNSRDIIYSDNKTTNSDLKDINSSKSSKNIKGEGRLKDILNHFGSQNVGSTHAQLWQFLLELLANPELAEDCIHWEGGDGEFRMVDPEEVARKWGRRKRRTRMNFEKMGRALRYYYDKMILKKIAGKKWTYQFNLAGILCQGKKQLQECLEKFEKSNKVTK